MANVAFYNPEIDIELEKIDEKCDYYRSRVKQITSDIYNITTWVNRPLADYQIHIIKTTYVEFCDAALEKITYIVAPIAYKRDAEKRDLEAYAKQQMSEYASQYKAYCIDAIHPNDSLFDTKELLKKVVEASVRKPWNKSIYREWRVRIQIMLWSLPSVVVALFVQRVFFPN